MSFLVKMLAFVNPRTWLNLFFGKRQIEYYYESQEEKIDNDESCLNGHSEQVLPEETLFEGDEDKKRANDDFLHKDDSELLTATSLEDKHFESDHEVDSVGIHDCTIPVFPEHTTYFDGMDHKETTADSDRISTQIDLPSSSSAENEDDHEVVIEASLPVKSFERNLVSDATIGRNREHSDISSDDEYEVMLENNCPNGPWKRRLRRRVDSAVKHKRKLCNLDKYFVPRAPTNTPTELEYENG